MPRPEDDEVILDFMRETGIVVTPRVVAWETDLAPEKVRHRMRVLLDRGFVRHPSEAPEGLSTTGVYELTEAGGRYASGEMTIEELRNLVADPD